MDGVKGGVGDIGNMGKKGANVSTHTHTRD